MSKRRDTVPSWVTQEDPIFNTVTGAKLHKNCSCPRCVGRRHVSGAIRKRERGLSVPDRHQLRIARDSMRQHCAGLAVLGGPDHYAAAAIIQRLTGQIVAVDADCTCERADG